MTEPVVHVIDGDAATRDALTFLLDVAGFAARTYESAEAFEETAALAEASVIVADVRTPRQGGVDLLRRLQARGVAAPIVVIIGHGEAALAAAAMKAGAADFLERPFDDERLLAAIRAAGQPPSAEVEAERSRFKAVLESLSVRERDVLDGVVAGKLNKVIAQELGVSPRTVEVYRTTLMSKTGARGVSDLMRMTLAARAIDDAVHTAS